MVKTNTLFKKIRLTVLVICLICTNLYFPAPKAFGAAESAFRSSAASKTVFSDLNGHWAAEQLSRWSESGLIKGYADGTIRPDQTISRGEWMALINRSFGYNDKAKIAFADLEQSNWAYDDVAIAVREGYVEGLGKGEIGVNLQISRQEAALILSRLLGFDRQQYTDGVSEFTDADTIPDWSRGAVGAAANEKVMLGYGDGSFKPLAYMTRAEAVVTLDRALKSKKSVHFNMAGTYGPSAGIRTVQGDAIVSASGATLQNMKIAGNLLLDEAIGQGEVYLRNVTVLGTTTVKGGGKNSIHFVDSALVSVTIDKKTGIVRIVTEGKTTVAEMSVKSSAILENASTNGSSGFKYVRLTDSLIPEAKVTLIGRFEHVDVESESLVIEIPKGVIQLLSVAEQAANTRIDIGKETTVLSLIINALIHVTGQGKIEKASISEKGKLSTFEKQPNVVEGTGVASGGAPPVSIPSSMAVVKNGQALAVVVVPSGAAEPIRQAANALTDYLKKSTGAQLSQITVDQLASNEQSYSQLKKIFVGVSRAEDQAYYSGLLQGMDADGFIIDSKADRITIIGPTAYGTQYGALDFLERYVGVRWLLPGPDGEDVPQSADLYVPLELIKQEPDMKSRTIFGTHTPNYSWATDNSLNYEWGLHNRLNDRIIGYQHNLWYLFMPLPGYPGENYPTTHPEFYPMRNGERYIPTSDMFWQPCFTESGTVKAAIDSIIDYFDKNPEKTSFSLAVNDGWGFCEDEPGHPDRPTKKNSLGRTDMSDIYFTWVNKVVEGVLKVYPDKWFGVLAYEEVNDPPSFDLNPRVIPYFTKDRMAWIDDGVRAKDQASIEAWNAVTDNLAFYDYVFGTPYTLPRVYNHLMAEYLKYFKDEGGIAYFGEMWQNWGEGPKIWLLSKLLWNADQDVDVLLNDWYERAVGKNAAADLKAYFDLWENFWTKRIQSTDWFQERKGITFLSFYMNNYLEEVTDADMKASRALLESVLAKAETPQQKARAQIMYRQFEYYEASALSYPKKMQNPEDLQSAMQLLEEGAKGQIKADYAIKRIELVDAMKGDPILEHPWHPVREGLVWSGWNPSHVWALVSYIRQHELEAEPLLKRIDEMAADRDEGTWNYARLIQHALAGETINLNPSFESGTNTADAWETSVLNFGEFQRVERSDSCYSGNSCLYLHKFYYGTLSQTLPVKPGLITAQMRYYTSGTRSVGDTWLQLDLLDENGATLKTIKSSQQAYSATLGRWTEISVMDNVPETINGIAVKQVKVSNTVNGFFEGGDMYIDDFEVYQSAEQDPPLPIVVSGVQLSDDALYVSFHEQPNTTPVAGDFTVVRKINGLSSTITPTGFTWIADENKAILNVPAVKEKVWEQNIAYTVTYRSTAPANSLAVLLPVNVQGHESIGLNSSFEQWSSQTVADHWIFWGQGFTRSDTIKRTGNYSLAADGLQPGQNEAGGGGPLQTVPLGPGHYTGVFRFNTLANTAGKLSWFMQLKDSKGAVVKSIASELRPAAISKEKWTPFEFEFDAEEGVASVEFLIHMKDFKKGDTIYFDDIELYKTINLAKPLANVEAAEGNLVATFMTNPGTTPVVSDFTVERIINGKAWESLVPSSIGWDAASKKATLVIPELLPSSKQWEQSIVYKVSYRDTEGVMTSPMAVPSSNTEGFQQHALNQSFEQWDSETAPANWSIWGGGFSRSAAVKRTGDYSLMADGLQPGQNEAGGGGPYQVVSTGVEAGRYLGVIHYNTSADTRGTLYWFVQQKDSTGAVVKSLASEKRNVAVSQGTWTPFELEFEAEEGVTSIQIQVIMNDFNTGEKIYFDDIELLKKTP